MCGGGGEIGRGIGRGLYGGELVRSINGGLGGGLVMVVVVGVTSRDRGRRGVVVEGTGAVGDTRAVGDERW